MVVEYLGEKYIYNSTAHSEKREKKEGPGGGGGQKGGSVIRLWNVL